MPKNLIYVCSCILATLLVHTGTATVTTSLVTSQFLLLTNPYLKFVPLGVELAGVDLFTCARLCLFRNNSCFSFVFNEHLNICSLGSWPLPSPVAISHVNTYRSTQPCNTAANFNFQQSGDVRVCVRMSPDTLNYTDAREVCKAFGGNLYTAKTTEKLSIIKAVNVQYQKYFWMGLNDLVTEDVFQWVDDGTIVPDSWRKVIFAPGEPNNSNGNEDCVGFSAFNNALNDGLCSDQSRYLCEMATMSN